MGGQVEALMQKNIWGLIYVSATYVWNKAIENFDLEFELIFKTYLYFIYTI